MKNIVILGAGTGGALSANLLSHRLNLAEWKITVIDRADLHVYQPGLLFLPFGMYGYREQADVVKPIVEPLPRGVGFITSEVHLIDHETARNPHRAGQPALRLPDLRAGLPHRARGDRGHGAGDGARRAHLLHAGGRAGDARGDRRR